MKFSKRALGLTVPLLGFVAGASAMGNHFDLHWTHDIAAYRSYDATGPDRLFSRIKSTRRPLRIQNEYLVTTLETLSGVRDPVLRNRGNAAGKAAAREFMRKEFESAGFVVSEHVYRTGTNLVAERAGASGKFLIVSAHYDSVNNAGADDDGTGVVAMLATAQALRNVKLKQGLRFVAFDEEERGLVGSAAYVKDLVNAGEKPNILGDFHMEMMGYNARGDGKFHVISCKRKDSDFMVAAYVQAVRDAGTGVQITDACTDRSDHDSFWKAGIPAIVSSENFFGGDSNPCYHRSCDTMANMHIDYFTKVAEVSANAVALIVAE